MTDIRILYGGNFVSPGGGARVTREIARALDAPVTMTHMMDSSFWEDVETDVLFQEHFTEGLTGLLYQRLPTGLPAKLVSQKLKTQEFEEDTLISTSNASMWIIPKAQQTHIHYCNTPPKFYYTTPVDGIIQWLLQTGQGMLDQHFHSFVDTTVANSTYIADRVRTHYHTDPRIITPPVETERYYHKPSDGYFVLIGRLVRKKRPCIAARAVDNLVIVGNGPLEDECREAGADVRTTVDDDELADIVARSEGGIALARDEHYGITPKEFQAAGKPVIVPDEPNLKNHVTDGEDGVIVDPTVQGVKRGVQRVKSTSWNPKVIQETAEGTSPQRFRKEIREEVLP